MNLFKSFTPFMLVMLIAGCAHKKPQVTFTEEPEQIEVAVETPPIVPMNPRIIEAELILGISNIKVLTGEKLRQDNLKRGVPETAVPQLHVWSSGIIQRSNQTVLDLDLEGPAPNDIFSDEENENQIIYWDLSDKLDSQDSIVIKRRVRIEAYELHAIVDPQGIPDYDFFDSVFYINTRSERFLQLNLEMRKTAANLLGQERNPYLKAELIHEWVNSNMSYGNPPGKQGASAALSKLRGRSGQYADLFVALCRAADIPARIVSGFRVTEKQTLKSHIWAEFYLPETGWIPTDPTRDNTTFGRLENSRLVTSVGRNIRLKYAPHWATFSNGEVEDSRTTPMFVSTVAFSGIRAKFNSSVKTLHVGESIPKVFSTEER